MVSGIVAGLEGLVRQGDVKALIDGLAVPPFVGRERALDLAVNVALPFIHAWAGLGPDAPLRGLCVEVYHGLPRPADNEITREMRRFLSVENERGLLAGARRHQGLIHLYKRHVGRISE